MCKFSCLLGLIGLIGLTSAYAEETTVHAAYVIYSTSDKGETLALARVIIPLEQTCPTLIHKKERLPTTARTNPNKENFPVTVCEAIYPYNKTFTVEHTKSRLPKAAKAPKWGVVMGDTGCKGLPEQECTQRAWPFGALASNAAKQAPEIVFHTGDYNYRGTPDSVEANGSKELVFDANTETCSANYVSQNIPANNPAADNWNNWQADFFTPAKPLLNKAPWVAARGNRELCSRGGPGWFYFLDPASDLLGGSMQQRSCAAEDEAQHLTPTAPYRLVFGHTSIDVIDSSLACGTTTNPVITKHYTQQLQQLTPATTKTRWLLSHRPVWELEGTSEGNQALANQTLQQAGLDSTPYSLILSGHLHLFQQIRSNTHSTYPTQLIVGNSGVKLETYPKAGVVEATINGEPFTFETHHNFGYFEVSLTDEMGSSYFQ